MQHLQPNTTLQGGKYRIERVLGQGGFGITYLAHNTVFDIDVAIKEFFMKDENDRDGSSVTMPNTTKQELFQGQMEKFKKEAKRMFAIKNEHIIGVQDLFEENGTAYYVMDFVDGENLAERLKRTGKPMTEQEVRDILPQILDALKSIHDAGIWHLDLKPANIMLEKGGKVKLIDFGASKQLNAQKGGATTSTAISYTNGYAPREQMEQNYDKFGPWTDIYALGATFYNLLTDKRPPLPSDIDDDDSCNKHLSLPFSDNVSSDMRQMVVQMMQTNRKNRPQAIDDVKSMSGGKTAKQQTAAKQIVEKHEEEDSEATIIATPKTEETIIEANPAVKPKSNPVQESALKPELKEQKQNSDDSSKSERKSIKMVLLVVAAVIVLILIFIYNGSRNTVQYAEVVDSIAAVDPVNRDSMAWDDSVAEDNIVEVTHKSTHKSIIAEKILNNFLFMEGGMVSKKKIEPFWISRDLVSRELWYEIMEDNHLTNDYPIDNVSWNDCQKFIEKLNEKTGMSFRMPTNDEWTYASTRGIKGRISEWTTSPHCYSDNSGYGKYSITRNLAYKEETTATRVLSIKERGLGFRLAIDKK